MIIEIFFVIAASANIISATITSIEAKGVAWTGIDTSNLFARASGCTSAITSTFNDTIDQFSNADFFAFFSSFKINC